MFEGVGKQRGDSPICHGVDADLEIIRLIGASARSGRANEIPSDWGLLAWLLAPQGMDSVSPAREHGTQSLGLERAMSPDLTSVKLNLQSGLKDELTGENRDAKTGGRLHRALGIRKEAEDDCNSLSLRMESYFSLLQELHRIEIDLVAKEQELELAREEEDRIRGEDVDTASLEGKVETAESRVKEATNKRDNCQERLKNIHAIIIDRDSHDKDAREATKNLAKETADKDRIKLDLETTKKEKEDLDSRLRQIKTETNSLLTLKSRIRDQTERKSLTDNLKRALETENALNELKENRRVLPKDEIYQLELLEHKLRRANIAIEALASQGSRLEIEGKMEGRLIIDGEEEPRRNEMGFVEILEVRAKSSP